MSEYPPYIPLLKGKQGEFLALSELTTEAKARILPLIDVPPPDPDWEKGAFKKPVEDHLSAIAKKIAHTWGTDRPILLDLFDLDLSARCSDGTHPMVSLFANLRQFGVAGVPTTGFDRDTAFTKAVAQVISKDHSGVCLRLLREDVELPEQVNKDVPGLLESLGISSTDVHLILDFQYVEDDDLPSIVNMATSAIENIDVVNSCKTLALAGSGFPDAVSSVINRNKAGYIRRTELDLWESVIEHLSVGRKPFFGDYCVAHPDLLSLNPKLVTFRAAIRYTLSHDWLVVRGASLKRQHFTQFHRLADALIHSGDYAGPGYSWGDRYISDCAARRVGSGNLMKWRQVGTNRHLTFVGEQIAKIYAR